MRRALLAGLLLAAALTAPPAAAALPDGRAWELVSPPGKEGGAIAPPGALFGGGEIQAAAAGGAITYSSATAFGQAPGAPPASQYLSVRSASGWLTENVSQPLESGGYGDEPDGVPYRVFSADLARALLMNPRRCEPPEPCPRPYSVRESSSGALTPLPAAAAGMRVLAASPDLGRILFEDEAGEVFEWSGGGALVPAEAPEEPEPVSGILGVLGASASGEVVYYQDAEGLKRWQGGVVRMVAAGADAAAPSDWPAATGTARVSADGEHLAFLSEAPLTGYDNRDAETGEPDAELFLWGPPPGGGPPRLICVSCDPSGERPTGPARIPGALPNGSTRIYKPRALAASGNRVFFESPDRLATKDADSETDVYQWEAQGEGDCAEAPGCQSLLSGGLGDGAAFLDASAEGADVYFLTEDSLVGTDPGSLDVYDARIGGGLPEPQAPFVCVGDLCQLLPSPPEDPTPGTLRPNGGNPAQRYDSERHRKRRCPKGKVRRRVKVGGKKAGKGGKAKFRLRCVKRGRHGKHHRRHRQGRGARR